MDAMKKLILLIISAAFPLCAFTQTQPARPPITGIDNACFYTTSPDSVKHLYCEILGLSSADPVEPGQIVRYMSGKQWVGYSAAPDPKARPGRRAREAVLAACRPW